MPSYSTTFFPLSPLNIDLSELICPFSFAGLSFSSAFPTPPATLDPPTLLTLAALECGLVDLPSIAGRPLAFPKPDRAPAGVLGVITL